MANVPNVNVNKIKTRAKAQGITLVYLNRCLGKHDSFLSCVRNGTDHIDEDELAVIAEKINTTIEYLTDQTDDPEPPAAPNADEPISPERAALLARLQTASDEEVRRITEIVDFVLSKRN